MGSVFLRGDSWVGEYKDRGKIKRVAFGKKGIVTKTLAKEMLKKKEQNVKLGQYDMLDARIPTLSEFSEEYIRHIRDIKQNRSWVSALYYLNRLKSMFGDTRLSQITSKDIDDYKLARLREVKPATVNRELACLSHLFNLAKRQRAFWGENPVALSKLLPEHNQVERILTRNEEERLLASSPQYLKPILICALNTGMRKNEILTLKWTNVDLENNVITLEHTNTKSKKTRRIPINSTLRTLLLEQKLKSSGNDYVFLSSNGNPYKRHDSLKQSFLRACRVAEIKGLRFHDLRHTAATRMIENGASIVAVSRILGHADLKTTMRYAHPDDSLKEAVESLSRRFSDSVTDRFTDKHQFEN